MVARTLMINAVFDVTQGQHMILTNFADIYGLTTPNASPIETHNVNILRVNFTTLFLPWTDTIHRYINTCPVAIHILYITVVSLNHQWYDH